MAVVIASRTNAAAGRPSLRLGLINNMPDAALARTERQFIDMLEAAAPDIDIALSVYAVPGIPRGELGEAHLAREGYRPVSDLKTEGLDALIVTGTEPRQQDLRAEPYWPALTSLFDWIGEAGPSTIFSCLAAHAAVLHFDGIERQRLTEKRCGLFEHAVIGKHALAENLPATVRVAHSRWNEVSREALAARGYDILTEAPGAGVDLFVKRKHNLMVFFQGHPEYDSGTLFREYRRDIQRFLTGTNDNYPLAPRNYFDDTEADLLHAFQDRALANRDASLLEDLPVTRPAATVSVSPMTAVYRSWLLAIVASGEQPATQARLGGMQR
jgi:homoserine O-succinyltransferase